MAPLLPLLKRATEDGSTFVLTPAGRANTSPTAGGVQWHTPARIPLRAPGPGEQYRFHFDTGKCIGCLPPSFGLWRRSGVPQRAFLPLLGLTAWSLLWLHLVVLRLNAEGRIPGSEGRLATQYTATSSL